MNGGTEWVAVNVARRQRVRSPVSDKGVPKHEGRWMATDYSKGLAWVFVNACNFYDLLISNAYKNHDRPAVGDRRRRAKHGQRLDFKLFHKGTTGSA